MKPDVVGRTEEGTGGESRLTKDEEITGGPVRPW